MGSIHVHEFISLDGVIDAPTWTFDYGFDPKLGEAIATSMAGCQGILLGRTTYEMFEPAWSQRTAPWSIRSSALELVALHRVAELIVAEAQRRRRLALVPAAFLERRGEDRFLIFGDGEPEIGAMLRIPRARPGDRGRRRGGGKDLDRGIPLHRLRPPGRFERIELDPVDRPVRILPAIDGALDDVAELADVAGVVVRRERGHGARRDAGDALLHPAGEVLRAYMSALRARGGQPLRDWDRAP